MLGVTIIRSALLLLYYGGILCESESDPDRDSELLKSFLGAKIQSLDSVVLWHRILV